jgi:hypothetical protein
MKTWIVETYYQNKHRDTFKFKSRDEAMAKFNSLCGAFKFGLVGWSASYP